MNLSPRASNFGSVTRGRSALTVMMDRAEEEEKRRRATSETDDIDATPRPYHPALNSPEPKDDLPTSGEATPIARQQSPESDPGSSDLRRLLARQVSLEDREPDVETATERTSLLVKPRSKVAEKLSEARRRAGKLTWKDVVDGLVVQPLVTLPSVVLGTLLNVLDGVSYGMIL